MYVITQVRITFTYPSTQISKGRIRTNLETTVSMISSTTHFQRRVTENNVFKAIIMLKNQQCLVNMFFTKYRYFLFYSFSFR